MAAFRPKIPAKISAAEAASSGCLCFSRTAGIPCLQVCQVADFSPTHLICLSLVHKAHAVEKRDSLTRPANWISSRWKRLNKPAWALAFGLSGMCVKADCSTTSSLIPLFPVKELSADTDLPTTSNTSDSTLLLNAE